MRIRFLAALGVVLLLGGLATSPRDVAAAWQPTKPVEFVVAWAAGGGTDVLVRTLAGIVESEKLAPVPFVVVNKVGGNAMVAQTYVLGKKGDPHVLMATAWILTMVPVTEKLPLNATLLTPIARLLLDEQLYWVKADSPYKSIKDVVNAAKKAPGSVKVAGVVIGSEDHVTNAIFETAAGIKTNYIAFKNGGDIMREVLGGHVDVGIMNPSEAMAQYEGKLVRPLAVASRNRLPGLSGVPTFKEEGYDVVFEEFQRGVAAPPAISPDAANYYIDLMRRVTETAKWKAFIKENWMTPAVLPGKEFGDYIKAQEETVRRVLTPLGLVKQ